MSNTYKIAPGCYVDSSWGIYAIEKVINLAVSVGFVTSPYTEDQELYILEDAEDWLNKNFPYPRHSWGWNDGNFGLWRNDSAES